ncbi:hypothetical protein H8D36_03370 [archaeon]|nr:hypothetical protein [archaeon]
MKITATPLIIKLVDGKDIVAIFLKKRKLKAYLKKNKIEIDNPNKLKSLKDIV